MSNTATKHTPTPWVYDPVTRQIWDAQQRTIIDMDYGDQLPDVDVANAAFIVRACNSHDQLVRALQAAQSAIETSEDQEPQMIAALSQVEAALAAAGA